MASVLPGEVAAFFRRPSETISESDANLLSRFVRSRDETAFASLVRRHGPMVLAVCRRRCWQSADAEDAFQAVFFALARDAARINRRESVAGWLYRVAYLVSLKQAGKLARQRIQPLTVEPSATMTEFSDSHELKPILDDVLSGLTDKLRAVAVACLVEGRTNTDAAQLLGIPVGTVDSRLNSARQKLRAGLARRGISLALLATLESTLTTETAAAASRVVVLADTLVLNALNYAAGMSPAGVESSTSLAEGVSTMTTSTITRWVLAAVFSAGVLGGAGWGVYSATAQAPEKPAAKTEAKPKLATEVKPTEKAPPEALRKDELQAAFNREMVLNGKKDLTMEELIRLFEVQNKLRVRFDTAAFVRRDIQGGQIQNYLNGNIKLPAVDHLTASEVLREALAQLATSELQVQGLRLSYRFRGNQVLIVPEYKPATIPGSTLGNGEAPTSFLTPEQIAENIYGEPVTLRIRNKPFTEVLEELREMTGANIVVDARLKDKLNETITASFNDVRLFTVLKVLGNSCEMRPVVIDNVYYLTTEQNAVKLQKEINRDLFGEPAAPGSQIPWNGGMIPPQSLTTPAPMK